MKAPLALAATIALTLATPAAANETAAPNNETTNISIPSPAAKDVTVLASLTVTEHTTNLNLATIAFGYRYPGIDEVIHDMRWVRNFGDDWVVIEGLWRSVAPDDFVAGILPPSPAIQYAAELRSFHQGLTGDVRTLENDLPPHHGTILITNLTTGSVVFEGIILENALAMIFFERRGAWVDTQFEFTAAQFDSATGETNEHIFIRGTIHIVDALEID